MKTVTKVNMTEARQGETRGNMRRVLGVSVLLVILIFAGLYGYTTLYTPHQ